MAKTREELQQQLNLLDRCMPVLMMKYPEDADFWPAFAGEADLIQDQATARDYEWVAGQIDTILAQHGKVISPDVAPSDDLPPT